MCALLCSQDLQDEVAKEGEDLQHLQAQRQKVQQALEELDQQKATLEEQLTHIRQQTNHETQLVGPLIIRGASPTVYKPLSTSEERNSSESNCWSAADFIAAVGA